MSPRPPGQEKESGAWARERERLITNTSLILRVKHPSFSPPKPPRTTGGPNGRGVSDTPHAPERKRRREDCSRSSPKQRERERERESERRAEAGLLVPEAQWRRGFGRHRTGLGPLGLCCRRRQFAGLECQGARASHAFQPQAQGPTLLQLVAGPKSSVNEVMERVLRRFYRKNNNCVEPG